MAKQIKLRRDQQKARRVAMQQLQNDDGTSMLLSLSERKSTAKKNPEKARILEEKKLTKNLQKYGNFINNNNNSNVRKSSSMGFYENNCSKGFYFMPTNNHETTKVCSPLLSNFLLFGNLS